MRKFIYSLSSFLIAITAIAQENYYVSSPLLVYEKPSAKSIEKGVLLRSTQVEITKSEKENWYQVTLDNGQKGFITINNLSTALYSNDNYEESPSPIIDEDEFYGAPHVFTTQAALKIYSDPNEKSSVITTLLNGTAVPIGYYPFDEEAWVNIGPINKNDVAFTLQKNLGARPVFKDLEKAFLKSSNMTIKTTYAEDMLELSWSNDFEDQKKALQHNIELATLKNETAKIEKLSALLTYVKGALQPVSEDKYDAFLNNKKKAGFVLNGKLEPEDGFTQAEIETSLGKRKEILAEYNLCGEVEGDLYRAYEFGISCINKQLKFTKIYELDVTSKNNGFRYDKFLFTQNTSRKGLVETLKGYLNHYNPYDESFSILSDFGAYTFYFENDKLKKVIFYYYC